MPALALGCCNSCRTAETWTRSDHADHRLPDALSTALPRHTLQAFLGGLEQRVLGE